MGRHQTEAAYLKSVLLWLQGNWAEPDPPRFYPLKRSSKDRGFVLSGGLSCIKSTRRENRSASCHPETGQHAEGVDESPK